MEYTICHSIRILRIRRSAYTKVRVYEGPLHRLTIIVRECEPLREPGNYDKLAAIFAAFAFWQHGSQMCFELSCIQNLQNL